MTTTQQFTEQHNAYIAEAEKAWQPHIDLLRSTFPNVELAHLGGGTLGIRLIWGSGFLLATDGEDGAPCGQRPSGGPFFIGWYSEQPGWEGEAAEIRDFDIKPDATTRLYVTQDGEPRTLHDWLDDMTDRISTWECGVCGAQPFDSQTSTREHIERDHPDHTVTDDDFKIIG